MNIDLMGRVAYLEGLRKICIHELGERHWIIKIISVYASEKTAQSVYPLSPSNHLLHALC